LKVREAGDFYRDLIEKLSKVNRRKIVRLNLSDRYRWSEPYKRKKPLKTDEPPKDEGVTA